MPRSSTIRRTGPARTRLRWRAIRTWPPRSTARSATWRRVSPEADVVYAETFRSQRVQHVALETHGTVGWRDPDGRLTLRTSSQVPFLTRDALCDLFGLERDAVRVLCGRVGGGFGGKQEMLTEDLVTLAILRTGRPVVWELTREEQFSSTTTRHPMQVAVKVGAPAGRAPHGDQPRRALRYRRLRQPCRRRDPSRVQ